MKIKILLLIFVFVNIFIFKTYAQVPLCNNTRAQDSISLVRLFLSANSKDWTKTWNLNSSLNNWFGVTLNTSGRVIKLEMPNNNLTGTLPAELASLCALQVLNLSNNKIGGTLPTQMFQMTSLVDIKLNMNQFTGQIPRFYTYTLTNFEMSNNQFSGVFPNIDSCYYLQTLNISGNKIGGTLPVSFFNYRFGLQYLYANNNQFTGSIPPQIGGCNKLLTINLSYNLLSGSIPPEINRIRYLDNPFSSLRELNLSYNQLTGSIPPYLGALFDLRAIDLSSNRLTGVIPPRLDSLYQLESLDLSANQLTGKIPATLGSPSNLKLINLGLNQLSGEIPTEIGNLKNLQFFVAHYNGLSGVLPSFRNVYQLRVLRLSRNQFTGTIPPQYIQFDSLITLSLSNNQLTGRIPAGLVGLKKLSFFEVDYNRFDSLPNFSTGFLRYGDNPIVIDAPYAGSAFFAGNKFTFDDLVPNMALKSKPSFSYTYLGQDSIICTPKSTTLDRGGSFTINLNIDGGLTSNVYRWFKDGKLIDKTNVNRLTLQNVQPCRAGMYSCQVTNPNVPSMTLVCPSQSLVVPEPFQSCAPYEITTFPNPVENTLNITIVSPPDDVRLMRLSNMLGQVMWSRRFDEGDVINGLSLDCGNFPNGSYFLSLYTEGGLLSLTKRVQVLKK
jgi:Leucine-rich repeat (LRR) protein